MYIVYLCIFYFYFYYFYYVFFMYIYFLTILLCAFYFIINLCNFWPFKFL